MMSNDVMICLLAASGYDRAAEGVAGAGRDLASQLGGSLRAAILGPADDGVANQVAAVADGVTVVDQPELAEYQPEAYLSALQQLGEQLEPSVVLLGSDTVGLELTSRLAARLGGSPMSDGTALAVVDGVIRVTRSAYGGKAEAVFELKRSPAVVGLRARGFDPAEATGAEAPVEKTTVELPDAAPTRVVERHVEELEGIPLEDAQLIVSGGRGLGGAEPFNDLRRLAELMPAALGASRSACDEGWVPPSWQVGQTGKKVAPELYLAIAISGAAQHMLGVSDAKAICAINTDPDAPIFRHCTFAIVEDYRKVVPLLIERLGELKQ
jgi:electron transfer flavoprotein alpha subunit